MCPPKIDRDNSGAPIKLSTEEKQFLLTTARTVIEKKARGETVPETEPPTDLLKQECGAFVTLNKQGSLRGCIGYIEAYKPLYITIGEMAEAAAFSDPRFPAVTVDEVEELEIEISVLSPLQRAKDPREVEVGVHGIYIKSGGQSGLLLPQVATEYGWDRELFLVQTCHKAGLPSEAWKEPDTEVYLFTAEIFSEGEGD